MTELCGLRSWCVLAIINKAWVTVGINRLLFSESLWVAAVPSNMPLVVRSSSWPRRNCNAGYSTRLFWAAANERFSSQTLVFHGWDYLEGRTGSAMEKNYHYQSSQKSTGSPAILYCMCLCVWTGGLFSSSDDTNTSKQEVHIRVKVLWTLNRIHHCIVSSPANNQPTHIHANRPLPWSRSRYKDILCKFIM